MFIFRVGDIAINETSFGTLLSESGIINSIVFMRGVTGVFYYGCGKSFCISQIPPVVFVYCHVDEVWIHGQASL